MNREAIIDNLIKNEFVEITGDKGAFKRSMLNLFEKAGFFDLLEAAEELVKHSHYDPKSERNTFKVEEVWFKGLVFVLAKIRFEGVE